MRNLFQPNLSDIQFNEKNWELHDNFTDNRAWFTENRDAVRLQLFRHTPNWPFDLRDYQGAYSFFDNQSRSYNGALIDLNIISIKGLESLVGIFKYPSPIPQSLGKYYVGIIWIPFSQFLFQVNFESLEKGTTGIREAMVAIQEKIGPDENQEPIQVNSMEELFENIKKSGVRRFISDDAQYDALFPDHPLSKVRDLIRRFIQHSMFNTILLEQESYRIK